MKSLDNGYFGALIFQEIAFFEHLKYNFKTSLPKKIQIFKIEFTEKMIIKMPFSDVKKLTSYDQFYVCTYC